MNSPQALKNMLQELEANTRLRVGLWAIVAILLLYASLVLNDVREELETEFLRLNEKVRDVSSVSAQRSWLIQADESRVLKMQAESSLWSSRSEGLAQATFQTWVDQQLSGVHVKNVRTSMLPVEEKTGIIDLWEVSLRIQGEAEPAELQRLLFKMESLDKVTIIETLKIYNDRRKAFDLTATAWFRKTP